MQTKHTFSILFFIRKNKLDPSSEPTIYMRLTVNGERAEVSTKQCVDPAKWNTEKGRIKGTAESVRAANHALDVLEMKANQVYNQFLANGKPINVVSIKNELMGIKPRQHSLLKVFESFNQEVKAKIGKGYAEGTYKHYQTTLRHLREFLADTYRMNEIPLSELNYRFLTDFDLFLKTKHHCSQNVCVKYIQRLRKVIGIALSNDWLEKDPFMKYKTHREKTVREYLTDKELAILENKTFAIKRLEEIRDMFVFSCYTGYGYAELSKFTAKHLVTGIDGEKWIITQRKKSQDKNSANVPLLPKAIAIIEKYANHPECKITEKLLPVKSNQKMNAYLKEIADTCGIGKNLTTHMARHTFATTVTLSNGVPIETVSKMLGHTDIRTTQIYAKVIHQKVSEDMKRLKERLTEKDAENSKNERKEA